MAEGHQHAGCPSHGLAESSLGCVTSCPECGVIHISLNYMTVRFEPAAFDELTRMLMRARIALMRGEVRKDEACGEPADVARSAGEAVH